MQFSTIGQWTVWKSPRKQSILWSMFVAYYGVNPRILNVMPPFFKEDSLGVTSNWTGKVEFNTAYYANYIHFYSKESDMHTQWTNLSNQPLSVWFSLLGLIDFLDLSLFKILKAGLFGTKTFWSRCDMRDEVGNKWKLCTAARECHWQPFWICHTAY